MRLERAAVSGGMSLTGEGTGMAPACPRLCLEIAIDRPLEEQRVAGPR